MSVRNLAKVDTQAVCQLRVNITHIASPSTIAQRCHAVAAPTYLWNANLPNRQPLGASFVNYQQMQQANAIVLYSPCIGLLRLNTRRRSAENISVVRAHISLFVGRTISGTELPIRRHSDRQKPRAVDMIRATYFRACEARRRATHALVGCTVINQLWAQLGLPGGKVCGVVKVRFITRPQFLSGPCQ